MTVRRLGLIALALVAGSCSCSKRSHPVVEKISVDAFEGTDVVSMTQAQLKERLTARLEASHFTLREAGKPLPEGVSPWTITLAAGLTEPEVDGEPASTVEVLLQVRQKGTLESFELRTRRTTAPVGNDVEAIQSSAREALDAALGQAVREARALIDLTALKDEQVAQQLTSSDDAVKSAAVRLLARRHDARALAPLLGRLETDDLTQIRETMGLLIELGNPDAVPALINASRAKDNVVQREIVFALGAIGGDEAEAYLDAVATGHDDPLVRASAEQALGELKDRRSREGARK
ncbi:MAG: HEAT repeat domain-containing protein [Myxococcales bacterium]|nr:HEAT repeat domain-containing protein [Myxococcales bacterium]